MLKPHHCGGDEGEWSELLPEVALAVKSAAMQCKPLPSRSIFILDEEPDQTWNSPSILGLSRDAAQYHHPGVSLSVSPIHTCGLIITSLIITSGEFQRNYVMRGHP